MAERARDPGARRSEPDLLRDRLTGHQRGLTASAHWSIINPNTGKITLESRVEATRLFFWYFSPHQRPRRRVIVKHSLSAFFFEGEHECSYSRAGRDEPRTSPCGRTRRCPPVREFAPHPREMGAYKRSSTWSKEGDRERDAAVRAQWRKLSHDPATLTRACAPAMQQAASELTKALCDFVELGLDDLDACAGANAALGASLARKGVAASDFDRFLERVLAEAEATLGDAFDADANQRWASLIDVFCGQCVVGIGPPMTPKSALGSPKPKKKSYTGGMYKKFAVSVGLKKAKSPVAFNLSASDSSPSPGQGPAPRERGAGDARGVGGGLDRLNDRHRSGSATPITAGPAPPCNRAASAAWRATRARDRGFERFFASAFWAIVVSHRRAHRSVPRGHGGAHARGAVPGEAEAPVPVVFRFFPEARRSRAGFVVVFAAALTIAGSGTRARGAGPVGRRRAVRLFRREGVRQRADDVGSAGGVREVEAEGSSLP